MAAKKKVARRRKATKQKAVRRRETTLAPKKKDERIRSPQAAVVSVSMSGLSYGGYESSTGRVAVNADQCWTWYQDDSEFRKQLETLLLGKLSPETIRIKNWDGMKTVVYKDETISRLHIETMLENFERVQFKGTPWEDSVRQLQHEADERTRSRELASGECKIRVAFTFAHSRQKGARLVLSAPLAMWIGMQLIECAEGRTQASSAYFSRPKA